MSDALTSPRAVLEFWFALRRPGRGDDGKVREAMGPLYERAAAHELDGWLEAPRERLALELLLDQAPRHLYRLDARAFATDLKAQEAASFFFARRDWAEFTPREVYYAALPYLHAEDAEKQALVNPVMHECAERMPLRSFMGRLADLYRETIARFGRFPHRNGLRGLVGTPAERRFLEEEWFPRLERIRSACPLQGYRI